LQDTKIEDKIDQAVKKPLNLLVQASNRSISQL
jgi:hypothetical protein